MSPRQKMAKTQNQDKNIGKDSVFDVLLRKITIFEKNYKKKFGGFKKKLYLCTRN